MCARARQESELHRRVPVTDPKNFTRVVATVGDITITAQEFLLSYEFGPAFAKRRKDSRKLYLDFMINEKLLALDARAHGLGKSARVRRSLEELEGDMATEELFKDDVLARVTLSRKEIAEGMREGGIHRSIEWVFASGEDEASSLYGLLKGGVPFDTLFAKQTAQGAKKEDRSLATTLFRLRRASPVLARVADSLRKGGYSAPVRGPDGWYILRVVDGWRDMTLSASESEKLEEESRRALTEEKSDSLSDRYVRGVMLARNPVIMRGTFNLLESWLARVWVKPDILSGWELASRPGADSLAGPGIDRRGGDTLVSLTAGCVRLGQFLSWYRARDTYFSLRTASEQSFFLSVEDLVWRMVRDRLLVDRAMRRNLQERDPVKKQIRWWEEKLLYDEAKTMFAGSIVLSDSACRAYYASHTADYRADSGKVAPFERVRESVKKDLYALEMNGRMLHRLIELKRKYRVVVKDDVLAGLPVDVENNPKAIETYVAKKGGTFPHPAFPVIDVGWQTWM